MCASSKTSKEGIRTIVLLRIASKSFSGVVTRTSNRSSAVKRSFSNASTATADVSCSTRIPLGWKSLRNRRVIREQRAREGATYATQPPVSRN